MKKRIGLIILLTVIVSAGTTMGVNYLFRGSSRNTPASSMRASDNSQAPIRQVNLPEVAYPDFTYAAETAVKSVVHVKVTIHGQSQQQVPQSFFDFFFGYGGQGQQPREQVGSGSGVIISEDGYIVTNNHVIDGADEVLVTLEDNREFAGTVIGADPVTDVALIKIEAQNLSPLKFGDSDALRLGQWVLAIGNPYNLRSTITAGIVSAKGRSLPSYDNEFKIEAFIQTDAAVNPGNSGGALVNEAGDLVGINTAIASRTGSYTGYSFAVPSSIVQKVVTDIKKYGSVQRAMLGITMQEITGDLAKEKNIEPIKGVYILEVSEDGAAQKAGVKAGDILVKINGTQINSSTSVQEMISRFSPGAKIKLTLMRGDKEMEVEATLQSQSGSTEMSMETTGDITNFLGAQLRPASKELKSKLRLRSGVEVIGVNEGKFKEAGIKKGFIITHVNQKAVTTVQDLAAIIQSSQRGVLLEGKYPDGSTYYYALGN